MRFGVDLDVVAGSLATMETVQLPYSPNLVWIAALRSPSFVRDAAAFAEVSDDAFDSIIDRLEHDTEFANKRALVEKVAEVVAEEHLQSVLNCLFNFYEMQRDLGPHGFLNDLLPRIRQLLEGQFDPETVGLLEDRIGRFVRVSKPGMERQAKAESLLYLGAQVVNELRILCDLRPVFDDDRNKIEGMVLVTSLLINESSPNPIRLRLDDGDLSKLEHEVSEAKRKAKEIRELIENKDIQVPQVGE